MPLGRPNVTSAVGGDLFRNSRGLRPFPPSGDFPMDETQHVRYACLEQAVKLAEILGPEVTTEQVVGTASDFYAFVRDGKTAPAAVPNGEIPF